MPSNTSGFYNKDKERIWACSKSEGKQEVQQSLEKCSPKGFDSELSPETTETGRHVLTPRNTEGITHRPESVNNGVFRGLRGPMRESTIQEFPTRDPNSQSQ